jgi:hypothetical protein
LKSFHDGSATTRGSGALYGPVSTRSRTDAGDTAGAGNYWASAHRGVPWGTRPTWAAHARPPHPRGKRTAHSQGSALSWETSFAHIHSPGAANRPGLFSAFEAGRREEPASKLTSQTCRGSAFPAGLACAAVPPAWDGSEQSIESEGSPRRAHVRRAVMVTWFRGTQPCHIPDPRLTAT